MICLSLEKLTLSFGTDVILENVSFSLNEGDKLGIVGANGAGKSTLFKLITGDYTPTSGNVYTDKNKKIGMLSQNPTINENNTLLKEVTENAFSHLQKAEEEIEALRIRIENGEHELSSAYATLCEEFNKNGGYEYKQRAVGMLISLGFDTSEHNRPIGEFSGGQKTRIALASLLLSEPDILLLDEPTNHLDISTLAWLEDFLSQYKKTLLVISHDRYFLDKVTTHILDIENTHAKLYEGNYSTFADKKKKDREIEEHHYKNQQREIKRIEEIIAQQKRWNREKNIVTAESKQKQIDRMEKLDKPDALPEKLKFHFNISGNGAKEVLTVRELAKSFGDNHLFSSVNFITMKDDHMFITGDNGCGKSTLIKILAGKLKADKGGVYWGQNIKFAYYDQENQNLTPDNTVLDELWNTYPHMTQTEIRNALAVFLFKGEDVIKQISVLSGGEKARLTLCKLMLSPMNVLLLDEPTNHLDITSREALEEALLDFDGTIIAVSHDRYFINKLGTRFISFGINDDLSLFDFKGNYKDFESYKKRFDKQIVADKKEVVTASKNDYLETKKQQAELRKRKKQYEKALQDSERIEKEIEQCDKDMELYATDHIKVAEIYKRKEECEEQLLYTYEIIENYENEVEQ